jgi:hypothetical protein
MGEALRDFRTGRQIPPDQIDADKQQRFTFSFHYG